MSTNLAAAPIVGSDRESIDAFLKAFLTKALPAAPTDADMHIPFLEMGANSLILMEVQRAVESEYGLTIAIPQFFQELTTMDALANFIEENKSLTEPQAEQEAPFCATTNANLRSFDSTLACGVQLPSLAGGNVEELDAILTQQMELASRAINQVVSQQLQFLNELSGKAKPAPTVTPPTTVSAKPKSMSKTKTASSSATVSHRMLSPLEIRARGLNETQSKHLEALIQRYTERTQQSKALATRYRGVLADSRAAVGFRFTTKEMLYPIVGERARGSHVWDVDGNEYVDITMGQGVTMFGHHPEFIDAALSDAQNDILLLGPRPPQTGEVAELICEFTGMERVTFTNSGTEAVMAALRLARAATRRNKIVMFENAYHGHSDNVMGRAVNENDQLSSVPVAPGITQGAVDDLIVLEYGSDEALDYIRAHGAELAAVIVEPVQSRRPELQPRAFLQSLRTLTEQSGTLLIFDEMITGFRIHPGGAQAWFGVRADIATYGKMLAGGLPIGVVAGAARYMDAIDGGPWQYGDASYPAVDRTIFGGTFCQHPAAMIAALATLKHLKAEGPALQETLNRRTAALAAELNEFFDNEDVPIKVVHFASLFRFSFNGNFELLFYHMMEKGIFIWEWRNYFLSTAHTDDDIQQIIQAVKDSIYALREGGFLPETSAAEVSTAPVPMIEAQRQLALLAAINPDGSKAYHVSPLLKLSGSLDVKALRISVKALVRRHDALRATIKDEHLVIHTLKQMPELATLAEIDLSAEPDIENALSNYLAQRAQTGFDLEKGPLFETHLIRLSESEYRVLLKAHHIVVDGLSMNNIVQELTALYSATLDGCDAQLVEPPQANEYQAWQAQWLNSDSCKKQKAYWNEQLSGSLPVLHLPADRKQPSVRSFQGGRYSQTIPESLFAAVKKLSRQHGCTHFMTLFSAYALWLHRVCAQDDLLVGMPVAGRGSAMGLDGGESLVSYCTHIIPIRSRFNAEQTIAEYLVSTRDLLLQGYQHQDFPFAEMMRDHPALPVSALFNLDRPGAAPQMTGVSVEWLSQPIHYTAFDLTLNLTEIGESIVLECDFNRDIFDASTIARFMGNFITLLEGMVAEPAQKISEVPLLSLAEQQQILIDWNATATDYPRDVCVHQLFEAQVKQSPDAVALSYANDAGQAQTLTYKALNEQANRLAHYLRAQGVGAESVVAVCLTRSPELLVALLAVLKAGGAYLPMDPAYPDARLNFMLDDANVGLVLTQSSVRDRLQTSNSRKALCLDTDVAAFADQDHDDLDAHIGPENLAYMMYTSGSTGQPKGTLIPHRGLMNYLCWARDRYKVAEGAGAPLHSSIGFDATITSLFSPLLAGCTLHLLSQNDAGEIDTIRAAIESARNSGEALSFIKLTPAHLELINATIPADQLAGCANYLVLGGEALLPRQIAPWLENAPDTKLINEYGPTETVVGCCVYEATAADVRAGGSIPIGKPIANTQLYVLDQQGQPTPIGVPGELYIGGDGVARGYHNRDELTAQRFVSTSATGLSDYKEIAQQADATLYRTGDLVRYLPDGNLQYLGRTDNQIKLRGFRIELGEIENVLCQQAEIREAAVVVQRRSDTDARLLAYITPANQSTINETALRASLAQLLPTHMMPNLFVVMKSMPITHNGKIDRASLPVPEIKKDDVVESSGIETHNRAARVIAELWQELLGVERVGLHDNFFELGGHSLLVLPMRDRLQSTFNCTVSPVEIFRYPTVALLSRFIDSLDGKATQQAQPNQESAIDMNKGRASADKRKNAFRQMKQKRQNRD